MKLQKYLFCGLGLLTMASCNDYLNVDAPSQQTVEDVFGSTTEANTALNGIYAAMLVNNAFGNMLYNTLLLNSDVDFTSNSQQAAMGNAPRRFDTKVDNSSVNNAWTALYKAVETANEFIYNLENSSLKETDADSYAQMMGEAKVLRAICYDEIVWLWGDVPFTLKPTYETDDFYPAIVSRDEIRQQLIDDLKSAEEGLSYAKNLTDGVERISKEACQAEIARLALNAGGYSLRPDGDTYGKMERPSNYKEFYQIAREYCQKVMESGNHSLTNSFQNVFVNECNFIVINDDDPIFEIPFGKESTGNWGYYQGPAASADGGETAHAWGACSGSVGVSDFYRYSFDSLDVRRDFINGMWSYTAYNRPAIRANYTQYNNKWSKLWNEVGLGKATTGSTGINFAYIRYTDVLLMFAEAENELNGPTNAAQLALKQVRERAFRGTSHDDSEYMAKATSGKDAFLKAVLDERAWEFAGENMRWKDLVRNNLYNEVCYYAFLRYYSVAENSFGASQHIDVVEAYDGKPNFYQSEMPYSIWYCYIKNPSDKSYFVNTTLPCLYLNSPYKNEKRPSVKPATYFENNGIPYTQITQKDCDGLASSETSDAWYEGTFYSWWNESDGCPNDYCLYSFRGFVYGAPASSDIMVIKDGVAQKIDATVAHTAADLPVLRYILPIPDEAINRAAGAYTQHYGYK